MRNTLCTGLAAAAVLAIGALPGAALASAAPQQRATASQAHFPVPAGHPFAVLLDGKAEVVDMTTGQILRTVRSPGTGKEFLWVAAAASGREFVLASRPRSGWLQFSVLRISRDGQTVSLRPVPLQRRLAGQMTGLAVSPDGTRFAFSVWRLASGEPAWLWEGRVSRPGRGRLWVSRTGTAVNPSWAADRRLAFGWWPGPQGRPGLRIRGLTGGTPGTPASPLAGARMIAPGTARAGGQITADGSAILSVVVADDGRARLDELAPGSGRVRRSFRLAGPASPEARHECAVLWASQDGRKIFTQCGRVQRIISGDQDRRVRLALTVQAAGYAGANTFAW